ncbi:hypothetical protein BD310DRAFT_586984 [Dichomitus squalens]|uniref:Uncharacterized protein n=1 Tax=Dichomitus squalens TaxID=114155 RepID=A0A4Q9Q7S2_9APHY|nr:hypothetical protein BD310DRAFT_586984 [Dichomitus squalens]
MRFAYAAVRRVPRDRIRSCFWLQGAAPGVPPSGHDAKYLEDPTGRMQAFVDQYFEEHPEAESDVEVDSEGDNGVNKDDEVDSAE